jgi:hypothetical protein
VPNPQQAFVTSTLTEQHEMRKCTAVVRKCTTNIKIHTLELYKIVSQCNMAPRKKLTFYNAI